MRPDILDWPEIDVSHLPHESDRAVAALQAVVIRPAAFRTTVVERNWFMVHCDGLDAAEFAGHPTASINRVEWTRVGRKWKAIMTPTADDPRDPSEMRGGRVYFDGEFYFIVTAQGDGELTCMIMADARRPDGLLDDSYWAFDLQTPSAYPGTRISLVDAIDRADFCMVEEAGPGELKIEHGRARNQNSRYDYWIRDEPVPHVGAWSYRMHVPGRPVDLDEPHLRIEFEIEEWAEYDGVLLPSRGRRLAQTTVPGLLTLAKAEEPVAKRFGCGVITAERETYEALSPNEAMNESFRPDFRMIFEVRDFRFAEPMSYVVGKYELRDQHGETHYLKVPITPDNAERLLNGIIRNGADAALETDEDIGSGGE